MYTLGEAAKAAGMSKAALSKAIAKGRLSAQKDDLGRYQIDPAELHRVYPAINTSTETSEQTRTLELTGELRELRAKVELLGELLRQVEGERDNLREQNTRLTALLAPPKPELPVDSVETKERKKSFFRRLFG